MKSSIPVAVVGAGRFGTRHLEKYLSNADAEVVALVDPDSRTQGIAAHCGAHWFRSVQELPPGLVRAATVAVPTSAHAAVGSALLRAGVDVLVEKPLALDLAGADALIRIAQAEHRILQVGHIERFNPAVIALRLPLGVRRFRVARRAPAPVRAEHCDVVLDLMIHDIELLIHWSGTVPSVVSARGEPGGYSAIDRAEATLAFADGGSAVLCAERGAVLRAVRVESSAGRMDVDFVAPQHDPLAAQIGAFLDAVRHRTAPVVSGAAGRAALAVALDVRARVLSARAHSAA